MRFREGEAVLGLWLPLAFATLVQCVLGFGGTPPERSELLNGWALPELAKAVRRDEEEGKRERLAEWFEGLKKRFGSGKQADRNNA